MLIEQQVDIKTSTYRITHQTPGHTTFGFWVNGGKCGDLTVRNNEVVGFRILMHRGGWREMELAAHEPPESHNMT